MKIRYKSAFSEVSFLGKGFIDLVWMKIYSKIDSDVINSETCTILEIEIEIWGEFHVRIQEDVRVSLCMHMILSWLHSYL